VSKQALLAIHVAIVIAGVVVCAEGLRCAYHMHSYIGTGQYWSNPWFYKGHACLLGLIALSSMGRFVSTRRVGR
jgi:hypothetical protein